MSKRNFSVAAAAVLLAGGMSLTTANAADLGGDCCADLEERVAELEATTARKGNSKVSLKISGWVQQQIMWWDDGDLDDVYIGDQGTTLATHTKFSGSAKINADWSAGFDIHLEWLTSSSFAATQAGTSAGAGPAFPLNQFWWIKNAQLGKLSLGKLSQASDNAALLADVSGSNLIPANWVLFDGASFLVRPSGGPSGSAGLADAAWGAFAFCHHIGAGIGADCNGVPESAVRYDSPTIGGFSVSASYGEIFWDVAARYRGTLGDFNVAVEGAFSQADNQLDGTPIDSDYFQIGAGVKHVPTGLFVYGAYGIEENDTTFAADFLGNTKLPDGEHWYLKGGVQKKWSELGATTIYGEYGRHDDMAKAGLGFGDVCSSLGGVAGTTIDVQCGLAGNTIVTDSEFKRWGFGIQQDIDAAAMALYVKYRHHELDASFLRDSGGAGTAFSQDFEDFDLIVAGAIIHY